MRCHRLCVPAIHQVTDSRESKMPTYEYRCPKGHEFDLFQRMSDEPRAACPECGESAERLMSAGAGLIFKGDGFYITDYRSDAYKEAASSDKEAASSEKKTSGSDSAEKSKGEKSSSDRSGGSTDGTGSSTDHSGGSTGGASSKAKEGSSGSSGAAKTSKSAKSSSSDS
jgi:putative FmdB family regulatory protein